MFASPVWACGNIICTGYGVKGQLFPGIGTVWTFYLDMLWKISPSLP